MLEPLCVSCSDILRSGSGRCSGGGGLIEMLTSADSSMGAHWWGAMAQNQLDWAALQEVDLEGCSISVNALTWMMLSAYEILGYK